MATAARKTPAPKVEAPTIDEVIAEVEAPVETVEQKKIRELREALAAEDAREATNPTDDFGRPKPVQALTEEQRQIRELEDQLAKRKAANIGTSLEEATGDDVVHIHFVRDGFTAAGQVWYRGQEVIYDRAGEAYALTKDKFGGTWLDLAGDTAGQYERFGDEYFRPGKFVPRRGEVFNDAISAEDARRGTAAPVTRL